MPQTMIPLPLSPKVVQKGKNQAVFEVQGLYPGYGVTVGNALRRVLLSSLEGVAVTEVKIKGVPHEFSAMSGVLEDVIMVILNLKNLRFKMYEGETQKVELKVKGEKKVYGSDFKLSPQITLANPDLYLFTVTDKKTEIDMELTIEKGIGYEPKDQRKKKGVTPQKSHSEIGVIALDAIFTPIKNVNFQVENMRVGDRTDFDKLSLEIETDGTITPEEAFYGATEILIKHFTLIFGEKEGAKDDKSNQKAEVTEADALTMSTEDLKLSTRTQNILADHRIKTVGDIMKKSEKALSELEGMGEKALTEIKKKLKKLKLELNAE